MTKQSGFSVVEVLLIVSVVGIIGFGGWYVWDKNQDDNPEQTNTTQQQPNNIEPNNEPVAIEEAKDPNQGYLVLEEWGLRFKIPDDLTDVEYQIHEDTASFFAKPVDFDVEYRNDYDELFLDEDSDRYYYKYDMGKLYRSASPTIVNVVGDEIEGRRYGDHYYFTSHAFSGLSTGAGPSGTFFSNTCDDDFSSSDECSEQIDAENAAFLRINTGENSLINSIEEIN